MDIKKKKEELTKQFNVATQQIQQLLNKKEQLRGKFQLLEELEKADKDSKKDGSKKSSNK